MIPFVFLIAATVVLRGLGLVGIALFESWTDCLRFGLAAMFLLTASAHWGKRRADLIRMVPASMPRADVVVTLTGVLEILGAAGLVLRPVAPVAAVCLAVLLVVMFPANVRAAHAHLTVGGTGATPLPLRALLQVVFIAALVTAGFARA